MVWLSFHKLKNRGCDEDGDHWKLPAAAEIDQETAETNPRGSRQKQDSSHTQLLRDGDRTTVKTTKSTNELSNMLPAARSSHARAPLTPGPVPTPRPDIFRRKTSRI